MKKLYLVSQLINGLTGGDFGETLCSRTGRNIIHDARPRIIWRALAQGADAAFSRVEDDHCWRSFIRHLEHRVCKTS